MAQFDRVLRQYYDDRARVYDDMYLRREPTWRKNLETLAAEMSNTLSGRRVLEVACGTGFWTEIAAKVASSVVAVDASERMLKIARKRKSRCPNVEYVRGDAYSLEKVPGDFDAGLANFWLSHVPKSKINEFLLNLHNRLEKPAVVFMADNHYVRGIGGQLVAKTGIEDTFKLRELADGSKREVLKNYYGRDDLKRLFSHIALDLKVEESRYFWWVRYTVARMGTSK